MRTFYKGWYYEEITTFVGENGWLNTPKRLGVVANIAGGEDKQFKNVTEFKRYASENPPQKERAKSEAILLKHDLEQDNNARLRDATGYPK